MSIDEPPDPTRILILQFDRKGGLWKVLVGNRSNEPENGGGAHRRTSRIRRRRIGAAVLHRRAYFDTRRKAIEDQPPHFVFEKRDEGGVLGQIFRCTVNRRR